VKTKSLGKGPERNVRERSEPTVLLISANSMAMTVRERLGEVAVIRTLGFSRLQVAMLLFGECALIGVLGGLLGAGIALGCSARA